MNANEPNKIIYPELSYALVGILFKIHSELGSKYQEKYYQRAIEIELKKNGIKYEKEVLVDLMYNEQKIGKYFLDFLIEDKLVLEIKATDKFSLSDYKQIAGYLKSKKIKLGILANFRTEKLSYKRVLNSEIKYSH